MRKVKLLDMFYTHWLIMEDMVPKSYHVMNDSINSCFNKQKILEMFRQFNINMFVIVHIYIQCGIKRIKLNILYGEGKGLN